ncbi:hypothetical protein C8F01DRAFT_1067180 [Mycena amicta]|nr:hypothetical protein C8F01DRAFT_1067180 [Mycena amicta]
MARPLFFQNKYFFYPIGNTSAVSLLRDMAPEGPVDLLLLGCGDPRNVLFSVYSEGSSLNRRLDFTCCDIDPAIHARNILMYTMIVDNFALDPIWNCFFHFYVDKNSLDHLTSQCDKLLQIGVTLSEWEASKYSRFIRMGTEFTFLELRRHWKLYRDMHDLPSQRMRALKEAFTKLSRSDRPDGATSSVRSAGPLAQNASQLCSQQVAQYWRSGTTFSVQRDISAATFLNPTFVYSAAGEGANLHYGTEPLAPFHLAPAFVRKRPASIGDIVNTARGQFAAWCGAFRAAVQSRPSTMPVIRCIVSDAISLGRALSAFNERGETDSGFLVSQWQSERLRLNPSEYGNAPTLFHVIHSSNLSDHLGLLNILAISVPLLTPTHTQCVIYTESLLFRGQDATTELLLRLCGDIGALCFLFGVYPVDYVSGFSSRGNTHDLFALDENSPHFHQITTWKAPMSADDVALTVDFPQVIWDEDQLGALLSGIYCRMFEEESQPRWQQNHKNFTLMRALSSINFHYTRESFAVLLSIVKTRFKIPAQSWLKVINKFINLKEADGLLPMENVYRQDLEAHLHLQHHYTMWSPLAAPCGPFANWNVVPRTVRVYLAVPCKNFQVLRSLVKEGSLDLECRVEGQTCANVFLTVDTKFGTIAAGGTKQYPEVVFTPDSRGIEGTASLVVSFIATSESLVYESAEITQVGLSVRTTMNPADLKNEVNDVFGTRRFVFSANVLDSRHVLIVPEVPKPAPRMAPTRNVQAACPSIGRPGTVKVTMDAKNEKLKSLTATIHVDAELPKRLFSAKANPEIHQISSCVIQLRIGEHIQDVVYPIPVQLESSQHKMKLERKSSYIEIIVPPFVPFESGGMKTTPFPIVGVGRNLQPWNMHRVNLSRCPLLPPMQTDAQRSHLRTHLGSMLAIRELALSAADENHKDVVACVKAMMNALIGGKPGSHDGVVSKCFKLGDNFFFLNDLRIDLSSHTVIGDGCVISVTKQLAANPAFFTAFSQLKDSGTDMSELQNLTEDEVRVDQLLPALVERYRTWPHLESCEYMVKGRTLQPEGGFGYDPLCSCGKGRDVAEMEKVPQWRALAPFATRICFSPLFAVSYLETTPAHPNGPASFRCPFCGSQGVPKLLQCSGCFKVGYCSKECQTKNWKAHKPNCKKK